MTEFEHSQRVVQDKYLMLKNMEDENFAALILILGKIKKILQKKKNPLSKSTQKDAVLAKQMYVFLKKIYIDFHCNVLSFSKDVRLDNKTTILKQF